jgi:hypothetical protein
MRVRVVRVFISPMTAMTVRSSPTAASRGTWLVQVVAGDGLGVLNDRQTRRHAGDRRRRTTAVCHDQAAKPVLHETPRDLE